ncbi:MAG: HupE/UreJ family protein [Burkholderiales bacterium]|nr:HupE/UreJ family protein [Burkholderiales bacterium]
MTRTFRRLLAFAALAAFAGAASAHPGHASGFAAGIVHPFGGLDHLLAMVAVGLWSAAALPAARRWQGPAAFVGAMLAGAVLGAAGWASAFTSALVEPAVAASVVLLALLLAAPARSGGLAGGAIVAAAGIAHGFAHGGEAPPAALFSAYAAGFALSTAALHGLGLAAGARMRTLPAGVWRALAAVVALTGTALLAARV